MADKGDASPDVAPAAATDFIGAEVTPAGAAESPSTLDGQEIALLDSLLPNLTPRAQVGDEAAIDRVLKVLDLRLKYKRQRELEDQY